MTKYTIEITDKEIRLLTPIPFSDTEAWMSFFHALGAEKWLPGDGESVFRFSRMGKKWVIRGWDGVIDFRLPEKTVIKNDEL